MKKLCSVCGGELTGFAPPAPNEKTFFCSFECQYKYCSDNQLMPFVLKTGETVYMADETNRTVEERK